MAESDRDLIDEFEEYYRIVGEDVMLAVERRVLGCDYGGSSYTTRAQADRLAQVLRLGPASLLLDLGSGAGWPGIYLAKSSGCRVVLTDLPLEGLRIASARLRSDGVAGMAVAASGERIPLRDGSVDAVTSSDVMC